MKGGSPMDSASNLTLEKRFNKEIYTVRLVGSLIILAIVLNQISQITKSPLVNRSTSIFRTLIYFGLFISWGLSIRRRVMQKQVRAYLTAISSLMVLWLALRTTKYFFVKANLSLFRHLWYAYYTPMLFILLISLFIALSMGKPEDYKLPKWINLLYIPTLTLIVLVLTNDYHYMVFEFSTGRVRKNILYKHNIGYWMVVIWIIICAFTALAIMLMKSRLQQRKKVIWLPFIPLIVGIIYTFIYVFWFPLIARLANDVTVVLCLLAIGIFESCIYVGLIRSNGNYSKLFYASTIAALIVDKNYNICYKSKGTRFLPVEILRLAESGPIELDENTRLSSLPITGGHALWVEDISEINHLLSELRVVGDSLSENNQLLQTRLELKERQIAIEEKDRLYNQVVENVSNQIQILDNLLLEDYDNKDTVKEKLRWFCILGTYIKRRSNLTLIIEDSEKSFAKEFEYSLRESAEAISECGIECFFKRYCEGLVSTAYGLLVYDTFEEIIELILPSLEALFINLNIVNGNIKLDIQISCQDKIVLINRLRHFNYFKLYGGYIKESWEDETLYINIGIPKGVINHG